MTHLSISLRVLRGAAAVIAVSLLAAACTNAAAGDTAAQATIGSELTTPDASAVPESDESNGDVELPAGATTTMTMASDVRGSNTAGTNDVTNDGVLAAAVIIISDGDLEGAILEGLITEAEAEAALSALEDGNLSDYTG